MRWPGHGELKLGDALQPWRPRHIGPRGFTYAQMALLAGEAQPRAWWRRGWFTAVGAVYYLRQTCS